MSTYHSTQPFESKTHPSVKYTLRKWSHGRRREYNKLMAEPLHEYRLAQDELADFHKKLAVIRTELEIQPCDCGHPQHFGEATENGLAAVRECGIDGCTCKRPKKEATLDAKDDLEFQRVYEKLQMIESDQLRATRMKWAVASIEGLEIEGQPITLDMLLEFGPDELSTEISAKIEEYLFPSPEQIKNSGSPTTSPTAEGGATSGTAVDIATSKDSGNAAIAA